MKTLLKVIAVVAVAAGIAAALYYLLHPQAKTEYIPLDATEDRP